MMDGGVRFFRHRFVMPVEAGRRVLGEDIRKPLRDLDDPFFIAAGKIERLVPLLPCP
jgi:hypothetical protein